MAAWPSRVQISSFLRPGKQVFTDTFHMFLPPRGGALVRGAGSTCRVLPSPGLDACLDAKRRSRRNRVGRGPEAVLSAVWTAAPARLLTAQFTNHTPKGLSELSDPPQGGQISAGIITNPKRVFLTEHGTLLNPLYFWGGLNEGAPIFYYTEEGDSYGFIQDLCLQTEGCTAASEMNGASASESLFRLG